ncbi:MAG: sugar ABC transporter permease YjfF [Clostridiales Family XIII bacterium]|jgi:simple sugar transport system permease protein|nr:sugar ABC transporter permease YjfF [Clostridiales Family XIII bacterium]
MKFANILSRNSNNPADEITKRKNPLSDTAFLLITTVIIFVLMYVLGMILFAGKGFANPQNFFNLLNENAALIVLSCGLTIVMIAGGIDISVGGATALIGMSCVIHMDDQGGQFGTAIFVALGIGLTFGIVQGYLVAYLGVQPFIVTLAGMFFARGLTAIIETETRTVSNEGFNKIAQTRIRLPGVGSVNNNGVFVQAYLEIGVIVALVVVIALFATLRWTKFGRNLYAVGGNLQSALMLGINVKRTKFLSYVLCGLLTGIGGMIFLLHIRSGATTHASGMEMDAIASSIIGGTLLTGGVGSVFGTFIGALTKGTIGNIVRAIGLTGAWWTGISRAAMLCFFIVLQSVIIMRKRKKS